MKIGILTFHQALNYGAVLQMYALQRVVARCGGDNMITEIIDYRTPHLTKIYSIKGQISKSPIRTFIKGIHFFYKRTKFKSFIEKNIIVSKEHYDIYSVSELNDNYDRFIVGSDQVWNTEITKDDFNYFLPFADSDKRFSYAASIGISEYSEQNATKIRDELSRFQMISVREPAAKKTIDLLSIDNYIRVDMDPTLLLESTEWTKLVKSSKLINQKYILVYTVAYSDEVINKAVVKAKILGLKVIYVGQFTKRKDVKYKSVVGVQELLGLFYRAEYVYTNSFHGTVFSIVFSKRFCTCQELEDGRNSRISNLLGICGLDSQSEEDNIDKLIDWENVERLICENRQKSIKYIQEIIKYGNE